MSKFGHGDSAISAAGKGDGTDKSLSNPQIQGDKLQREAYPQDAPQERANVSDNVVTMGQAAHIERLGQSLASIGEHGESLKSSRDFSVNSVLESMKDSEEHKLIVSFLINPEFSNLSLADKLAQIHDFSKKLSDSVQGS